MYVEIQLILFKYTHMFFDTKLRFKIEKSYHKKAAITIIIINDILKMSNCLKY